MFQTNKQLLVSQADIVVVENPSEQKQVEGAQAPWAEEHLKGKAERSKPENLLLSAHGFKLGQ